MMKSLRWDIDCNTGSLRKYKPSLPFSISLSNIYVTVQACSRNITSSTNLANREKVNLQVPIRLSFQGRSSFLDKEKSAECTCMGSGCYFIHPSIIFSIQSFISLKHIELYISLLSQSLWRLCIT